MCPINKMIEANNTIKHNLRKGSYYLLTINEFDFKASKNIARRLKAQYLGTDCKNTHGEMMAIFKLASAPMGITTGIAYKLLEVLKPTLIK